MDARLRWAGVHNKCKCIVLVYMCMRPASNDIVSGGQAGGAAWPPWRYRYIITELHTILWYNKFPQFEP